MSNLKGTVVLVTGGAGAIGGNLCRRLLKENCKKVIILDNLSSGYEENIPKSRKIVFMHGSILDDSKLKEAFKNGIDIVFHLAANFANQSSVEYPERDLNVNGIGTLKVLDYAKKNGARKFIFASSSSVYGNTEGSVTEHKRKFRPDTPYALTKLLGEGYVRFYNRYHNLDTVILRYFNCFGPGERPGKFRNVIPNFIYLALNKRPLTITGTGDETRDYNFVDNAIEGTILAAKSNTSNGKIYNIGSGSEVKIIDIAKIINKLTGNFSPIVFKKRRKWDRIARRLADISKVKKELGYKPKHNLESQIALTVDWIKNQDLRNVVL